MSFFVGRGLVVLLALATSASANEAGIFDNGRGSAIVFVEVARPSSWEDPAAEDLDALSPGAFVVRANSLEAAWGHIVEDAPSGQARLVDAWPWYPVLEVEVTEAGFEYFQDHPDVVRLHAGRKPPREDPEFGRLSAIRTADRERIESAIRKNGEAKVVVQLRWLERPTNALKRAPRADRLFAQKHDVMERVSGPKTKVRRALGPSHLDLVVNAEAFQALLVDPEVVAIAAPPQ